MSSYFEIVRALYVYQLFRPKGTNTDS